MVLLNDTIDTRPWDSRVNRALPGSADGWCACVCVCVHVCVCVLWGRARKSILGIDRPLCRLPGREAVAAWLLHSCALSLFRACRYVGLLDPLAYRKQALRIHIHLYTLEPEQERENESMLFLFRTRLGLEAMHVIPARIKHTRCKIALHACAASYVVLDACVYTRCVCSRAVRTPVMCD